MYDLLSSFLIQTVSIPSPRLPGNTNLRSFPGTEMKSKVLHIGYATNENERVLLAFRDPVKVYDVASDIQAQQRYTEV